ncbi:MAG: aminotransferase class I/II-fold pyridoxal phosphate-dependent enzyme [Chitinophagaceae bacterium]|nr:aminotransferase class I/II-fold pyridoxal phosphate-dependent enzyme [Chitinophagaceae bacterium]
MKNTFFNTSLLQASQRIAAGSTMLYALDKNEQAVDISTNFKEQLLTNFCLQSWNRYPDMNLRDIEEKVALYCGLHHDNIVLSDGSASIITTLLNYFGLNGKHLVITQPSYSLFDYHCKTYNIPYEPWLLNNELQTDVRYMPKLSEQSVVFITSPNNPTGSSISILEVENLLKQYPSTLFIIDGVYTEFAQEDFTPLVLRFDNLMVLRSFSKAFPLAGLRLGYLCASKNLCHLVQKLLLPFSLNNFTIHVARELLFTSAFLNDSKERIQQIILERERMFTYLRERFNSEILTVYPSEGNFLLIRFTSKHLFEQGLAKLSDHGIKVLNTSSNVLLENTFRVSIGNRYENELFLQTMTSLAYPIKPKVNSSRKSNAMLFS